jgi:integrase/recombinase XerD
VYDDRSPDPADPATSDALVLMERALVSRDPLELALAGFLSAYKGRTFVKQRRLIKQYVDWCTQNELPPLTAKRPHIELYVRWCEQQAWSEAYIAQHFICVRSFYKACVRDEILVKNPAEFVNAPKVHIEGQARCFLTPLEFAAFLEASRKLGVVEHAATVLLGLCGLRVAELCSLRVESLSQDGGYDMLTFIGKGSKPAVIPLPIPVMRAVREVVGDRTSGPLLHNQSGHALTEQDARRLVTRIGKVAGCHHITPHGLRRTFCTSGLVSGVPMRDMQIAMRHADPRTTGLYDMAKNNRDRHASHRVASFLAGMTG